MAPHQKAFRRSVFAADHCFYNVSNETYTHVSILVFSVGTLQSWIAIDGGSHDLRTKVQRVAFVFLLVIRHRFPVAQPRIMCLVHHVGAALIT